LLSCLLIIHRLFAAIFRQAGGARLLTLT